MIKRDQSRVKAVGREAMANICLTFSDVRMRSVSRKHCLAALSKETGVKSVFIRCNDFQETGLGAQRINEHIPCFGNKYAWNL